jgi:hypothetical protein
MLLYNMLQRFDNLYKYKKGLRYIFNIQLIRLNNDDISIDTSTVFEIDTPGGKTNIVTNSKIITLGENNRSIDEEALYQSKKIWNEKKADFFVIDNDVAKSNEPNNQLAPLYMNYYKKKITRWEVKVEGLKVIKMVDYIVQSSILYRNLDEAQKSAINDWKEKIEREGYTILMPTGQDEKIFRPMLAKTYKLGNKIETDHLFVQPKLDGLRCICYRDRGTMNVILESRRGLKFQNFTRLREEAKDLLFKQNNDIYFDGELYTKEFSFDEINGLIRKTTAKTTNEDNLKIDIINYVIYDFYDPKRPSLKYIDRMNILKEVFLQDRPKDDIQNLIMNCKTETVSSDKEIEEKHDEYKNSGYEGIILRLNESYQVGIRSRFLQKYKKFEEEEFEILHCIGNEHSGLTHWVVKLNDGKSLTVPQLMGSSQYKLDLFKKKTTFIGKKLTVKYQQVTQNGALRFSMAVPKVVRDEANYADDSDFEEELIDNIDETEKKDEIKKIEKKRKLSSTNIEPDSILSLFRESDAKIRDEKQSLRKPVDPARYNFIKANYNEILANNSSDWTDIRLLSFTKNIDKINSSVINNKYKSECNDYERKIMRLRDEKQKNNFINEDDKKSFNKRDKEIIYELKLEGIEKPQKEVMKPTFKLGQFGGNKTRKQMKKTFKIRKNKKTRRKYTYILQCEL